MQEHRISHREHRELGDVRWLRDYDSALQQASQSGRPILLQFQEVPGCSTCVNYGVKRRSKGTPDRRRRGTPFSDMMLVC